MAKAKGGKGRQQRSKEQQAAVREARQAERRREQAEKLARERARRRKRTLVQIGTGVGVVAVLGAAVAYFGFIREGASDVAADGPPGTNDVGAVVTGEDSAPVTVEVISDFGCPACRSFDQQATPALDQYVEQGQIRLEYRVVAPLDRVSPNEFSSRAAAAAGCVLDQDDPEIWSQFKTGLFAAQPAEGEDGPSDTELIGIATQAGADEAAVTTCIDDGARADWADAVDSVAGGSYTSTPDVVVDGERLTEPTPAVLQSAIDGAIAAS